MEDVILSDLSFRFETISPAQAARRCDKSLEDTEEVIIKLERAGWLEVVMILAKNPQPLTGPLIIWEPGLRPPPFGSLSQRLLVRNPSPLLLRPVLFATSKTARAFGGVAPCRSRVFQLGHNLQLVEAFLAMRATDPERAETWIGEACWKRKRRTAGFIPDAMTTSRGVPTAVECGGAYGVKRLKEIHAACASMNLPYEIW